MPNTAISTTSNFAPRKIEESRGNQPTMLKTVASPIRSTPQHYFYSASTTSIALPSSQMI